MVRLGTIGSATDTDVNPLARLRGAGAQDWLGGLAAGDATVTLQARVNRDIGPRAFIQARSIVRIDAGRDIVQSIIWHQSDTDPLYAVAAGGAITDLLDDTTWPTAIRSEGGGIALVTASGDIMSPISVAPLDALPGNAVRGTIGRVESTAGDIGGARPSAAPPDNYTATTISARVIDAVVGRNVRNDVVAGEGVRRVEATAGGLRGSITAPTLLPISATAGGLVRASGVNAMTVRLSGGLPEGARISSGSFYGYLDSVAPASQPKIVLPDGGLRGQVLVNQTNQSPMNSGGTPASKGLMGPVVVGASSLWSDAYPTPSQPTGGG
ncbi:MAG: hypothetical protein K2X91_06375, partial [Thermoleophilia bacterium]|nr:hypothetical protein [Thermoleophilia bacterium]